MEAPLLKDLIDLGAEGNHGLGKYDLNSGGAQLWRGSTLEKLNSGGAGGQVAHVAAVEPPEDQAVHIEIPIELRPEDQAQVEAALLKDLIDLGAEDNATAAGTHKAYRRTTSGAIKVSTSSANIPGLSSTNCLATGSPSPRSTPSTRRRHSGH